MPVTAALFDGKRRQSQEHKSQRREGEHVAVEVPAAVIQDGPVEGTKEVTDALAAYEANMTSAEARKHFAGGIMEYANLEACTRKS